MKTGKRPVSILEVVDPAGMDRAIVEEEKLLLRAEEHQLLLLARAPGGTAVRRCMGDEVMQEEVEGENGPRETQNGQSPELELGETTHTVQDIIKLHDGEEMDEQVFGTQDRLKRQSSGRTRKEEGGCSM